MAPGIVYVRVHEPDAVREILAEAHKIAEELRDDGTIYSMVFEKAVDLLSARTVIQQQATPLDLSALRVPLG